MPIQVTSATTFTDIYNEYKPGLFGRGQDAHIRGGESASGAAQVYTHNPLKANGRGEEALQRRMEKYAHGATLVRDAVAQQYGADVAEAVFRRVSTDTGRDLSTGVTRGDLVRLRTALDTMVRSERSVPAADAKRDFATAWASDSRPRVAVALTSGSTISLPHRFYNDVIMGGALEFRNDDLDLRVQVPALDDGRRPLDRRQDNIDRIVQFIQTKCGREPGTAEFDNAAQNLLRYVHRGAVDSAAADVRAATGGQAHLAGGVSCEFDISVFGERVSIANKLEAAIVQDRPRDAPAAPDRFAGSAYTRQSDIAVELGSLTERDFDPVERQVAGSGEVTTILPRTDR